MNRLSNRPAGLRRRSSGVSNAIGGILAVVVILLSAMVGYFALSAAGPSTTTVSSTHTETVSSTQTETLSSTLTSTVVSTVSNTNGIVPLRIFAAASLTPALQALQSGYQSNYSVSLIYNFASSGTLETQIAQGVPADVFLSADSTNNVKLQNKSMLANGNTYRTLLYNSIEVFVPLNNPKNISTLADLLKPGVRVAMGAPASVPAGKYTLSVWQNVQAKWGNQSNSDFKSLAYADYSTNIMTHVVSQTTDVEAAITQVLTGAADAAFGYVSDGAANAAQLRPIAIPPDVNIKAVYTISVIASTSHLAQANAFVSWLLTPSGQAYFAKWGFTPLSS